MSRSKTLPGVVEFFATFDGESDRGAAMIAAAYLDVASEGFIRSKVVVSDAAEKLFAYRGPLGDFSGRIEVAYALGWLDPELRSDLHIIRDIRNDFAHDPNHLLAFTDPSISDRTRNLSVDPRWEQFITTVTSEVTDATHRETIRADMRQGLLSTGRKRFALAVSHALIFFYSYSKRVQPPPPAQVNPAANPHQDAAKAP